MMGKIYPRLSREEMLENIQKKYPLQSNPFKKSLEEVLSTKDEKENAKYAYEKREGLKRFWNEKQKEKRDIREKLELLLNPEGKRNFSWLYRHSTGEIKELLESIEICCQFLKKWEG